MIVPISTLQYGYLRSIRALSPGDSQVADLQ